MIVCGGCPFWISSRLRRVVRCTLTTLISRSSALGNGRKCASAGTRTSMTARRNLPRSPPACAAARPASTAPSAAASTAACHCCTIVSRPGVVRMTPRKTRCQSPRSSLCRIAAGGHVLQGLSVGDDSCLLEQEPRQWAVALPRQLHDANLVRFLLLMATRNVQDWREGRDQPLRPLVLMPDQHALEGDEEQEHRQQRQHRHGEHRAERGLAGRVDEQAQRHRHGVVVQLGQVDQLA